MAEQVEIPGARTCKIRGRVYVEIDPSEADAGDYVEHLSETGRFIDRVARSATGSVIVEAKRVGGVTLKGRGRRSIPVTSITRAWRARTKLASTG